MDRLAILFYDFTDDMLEKRTPYREEHLALLGSMRDDGRCLMAGVLGDPPYGAAIVFSDERAAAEFAEQDSYRRGDFITGTRIEPWAVSVR